MLTVSFGLTREIVPWDFAAVSKHYISSLNVSEFGQVAVIGVHFRAYPTDPRPCAQREAQAEVIADLVREHGHASFALTVDNNTFDRLRFSGSCSAASNTSSSATNTDGPFPYDALNISWAREVVVLGDLNDLDNRIPDIARNRPTSRALDALRAVGLYSVADMLPQTQRWTWGRPDSTDPRPSMLDHVFVSPGLYQKVSES